MPASSARLAVPIPLVPPPSLALVAGHPVVTVSVPAEFVVGTRHAVKDTLLAHLNSGAHVLLDFHDASYMDSTGLGVLLTLTRQFREAGRSLVLIRLSPELMAVVQMTSLDTVLAVQPDMDAALVWIAGQHPVGGDHAE